MRQHGIDISHWQGSYNPTPEPPSPVDFVVVKFSEGYAPASSAWDMWDGARKAKSAEGYHYWRTGATLQQQIDSFLTAAEGKKVDAAWLDWEGYNNTFNSVQYDRAYQWVVEMRKHFPKVGLYTNWQHYTEMNGYGTWHHEVPFWYARYINFPIDPFSYEPPLPKGCSGWDTWQYGICKMYGNLQNGRDYGVVSQTLDVNVRVEQSTPQPDDCAGLRAENERLHVLNDKLWQAITGIHDITSDIVLQ